jgi:hypothetical protein
VESEYVVNNVIIVIQGLVLTKVLLDSTADISIIFPRLLGDVQFADWKIRLKDIIYLHREAFMVHMPGSDLIFK